MTALPEGPVGVELALHDVELAIHLRQPARRLDEDQPVHPARDVVRHHGRGAVVHVEPRVERLEAEGPRLARRGLGHHGAATGTGRRVEVDRVDHPAVLVVLEGQLDGVPHADAQERPRHLAVERPVMVGRLVGEPADQLHGFQLDLMGARRPGSQRPRQIGGVPRDAHRRRQRSHRPLPAPDGQLPLHPGLPVPRQRAEVGELAALVRAEHGDAARALPVDPVGAGVELGEDHVVLDPVVVDQGDLHDIALGHAERRIDDPLDGAAHADERHLAVRQLRAEPEPDGRRVLGGGTLPRQLRRARRRLGRGRSGLRLGHVPVVLAAPIGGRPEPVHRRQRNERQSRQDDPTSFMSSHGLSLLDQECRPARSGRI